MRSTTFGGIGILSPRKGFGFNYPYATRSAACRITPMMSDEQIAQLGRQSTEFAVGEMVPGTKYLVVSRIGQGGMGSVYEVEHVELGKRFVLKALLDQFCQRQDLVQRLRNEWRSLGRLEHPNIVSVSDAGVAANGAPYYVMERLQGESLAGALQRLGRFSLTDSLRIAAEILEGLAAAHDIGIVHRDIKPPNIFVTQAGITKVLDFGIAKLTDGASLELTGRGIAIGTPRYMSPEQAAGERVDGRADLYAVGLVLFEMLSGCGPFDGCESHEVFLAHITRQPPRLGELVPGIPAELEGLVAALLAKRPADRPQSAAAAAAALRSMSRTYRAAEEMPDTQGEELAGALTPLLRAEYLAPAIPARAPVLGQGYVSGHDPTAGVSSTGAAFGQPLGEHRGQHTPAFAVRGSAPPHAPVSSGGRSWVVSGQQPSMVPSTRTAPPPEARLQVEPTPSGISRTAPPGYLDYGAPHTGQARRSKRWLGVAALVTVASGVAGWVLTQPDLPEPQPATAASAASFMAPEPAPAPTPTAPALGVIIGGTTQTGVVSDAPVSATAAKSAEDGVKDLTQRRSVRPRPRTSLTEYPSEYSQRPMEVLPVARPQPPSPAAAPAPAPPVPAPKPAGAPIPKKPGRLMPGSGIGAGG